MFATFFIISREELETTNNKPQKNKKEINKQTNKHIRIGVDKK